MNWRKLAGQISGDISGGVGGPTFSGNISGQTRRTYYTVEYQPKIIGAQTWGKQLENEGYSEEIPREFKGWVVNKLPETLSSMLGWIYSEP